MPVYALGFRIKDRGADLWTQRFNRFKFDGPLQAAAVKGACAVMAEALSSLTLVGRVVVVGAIPSEAVQLAEGEPVAALGAAIATKFGWDWKPKLLKKRRHQPLHALRDASERDATVARVYEAEPLEADSVLIVDDLTTRGATIAEISRALKERSPRVRITAVVLGKNESAGYLGVQVNNEHIPADYAKLWPMG
jgi:predicted amidophosphoribosyltransferase